MKHCLSLITDSVDTLFLPEVVSNTIKGIERNLDNGEYIPTNFECDIISNTMSDLNIDKLSNVHFSPITIELLQCDRKADEWLQALTNGRSDRVTISKSLKGHIVDSIITTMTCVGLTPPEPELILNSESGKLSTETDVAKKLISDCLNVATWVAILLNDPTLETDSAIDLVSCGPMKSLGEISDGTLKSLGADIEKVASMYAMNMLDARFISKQINADMSLDDRNNINALSFLKYTCRELLDTRKPLKKSA